MGIRGREVLRQHGPLSEAKLTGFEIDKSFRNAGRSNAPRTHALTQVKPSVCRPPVHGSRASTSPFTAGCCIASATDLPRDVGVGLRQPGDVVDRVGPAVGVPPPEAPALRAPRQLGQARHRRGRRGRPRGLRGNGRGLLRPCGHGGMGCPTGKKITKAKF